jgi:hypothetical protein
MVDTLAILLTECEVNVMGQQRKDQTVVLGIEAVDAAGNVVPFTPDAPPNWVNNNPTADPGVISPDGLTDTLTPAATANVGDQATVSLTVMIGGVQFAANITETITAPKAAPIAGVRITETLSPA